jgi:gluconate:H+ symporter, GntP family
MPQAAAVSGTQMLIGLVIGVALLVILVLRTKIHAFPAMILAASVTGLIGGMSPDAVSKSIVNGFGSTLGSIGLVIGFGVMMGRILEVSGAAERMAYTFLRWFGEKRPELAMALTGYMVSIPIFVDSGFVILTPLAKALSRRSGKSVLTLGVSLAIGLAATHHLVPPTPGPLGAAGIFGADVGKMILWGMVFAIPVIAVGIIYAKWLGRKIYQIPTEDGQDWERKEWRPELEKEEMSLEGGENLPNAFLSFAPILAPVVLILFNTVLTAMKVKGTFASVLIFLGQAPIAVLIGLLLAIYGLGAKTDRKTILKQMEEGVQAAGIIMLVTGAGGALGQVLRDSGAGNYLAQVVANSPVPAILLPFVVATLVRLVQGSGTVAMLTASSITAPILAKLGVNPVFAAQSAAMGAFCFSYFNDSLFWVVNRLQGIEDVKEQILTWSVPTTLAWATSGITLVIVNAFFG